MKKNLMKIIGVTITAFFLFPISNLFAQTVSDNDSTTFDPVHQFLWFHGHWNPSDKKQFIIDKDTTLSITVSSPGGAKVTVEPDGSVHINSAGIDAWNKKIDEDLKIIDDWENKIETPSSADLTTYHFNQVLLPDVKADKEDYSNYKIDPKTDVLNPEQEKRSMSDLANNVAAYCQKFKPQYDAIIAFWNAHKHDKDADLNIPPPPEFEYNCYACDSTIRKVYDTTIAHYVRDFFQPEDSLVRQGLGVIRNFALMGMGPAGEGVSSEFDPVYDLFYKNKKDPSKPNPCAYLDLYKLNEAVHDIFYHAYRRSQELLRRYRKDFRASTAITKTCLSGARNWELFGGTINEDYIFQELGSLVSQSIEFYEQKLKQHDWKQLANIPYILSLLRDKALLAGGIGEDNDLKNWFDLTSNYLNNFHLSIDMDIKIGKDGGYELAHLKGETKITPDFVQDSNQCYRWVVIEDKPKETEFANKPPFIWKQPVKKESQKIEFDLLTNEIIAPSPLVPKYTGTRKYYALLKNLKMDFCNPDKDSILITSFVPSPDSRAGVWTIPQSPPAPMGIMGMDHFFQDEEKMQELEESGEAQQGAEEMLKKGEELKAKMQALAAQMGNGKNKDNMSKYMELQKMVAQSQDIGNSSKVNPILYLSFQLPVENSDILVNKKFDAKEINPKEAEVIVYGYYTIRIEYKK
jgi:hypothetical protein